MDTIIQSSTVELLHTYGLPAAPRGRSESGGHTSKHDAVGIISFDGANVSGRLTLAVPLSVFSGSPADTGRTTLPDWTRELTNQLMGRIKNRLLQFQVKLRTHIPSVLSGAAIQRSNERRNAEIWYKFAALRGDILVSLDASLASVELSYSNASVVIPEGELIVFE